MATLRWYGDRVKRRVTEATVLAINHTMAKAVENGRDDHPGYPPASEPYERFASRTSHAVQELKILKGAEFDGALVSGTWGDTADYSLFLEIGTSTSGATAQERAAATGGDMSLILPPIGPLMAPRPYLHIACDIEYPLLAARIGAAYRGEAMP